MKEGLISVIVPIYDVENYLDKCIKSIINQIYKNLEIILVDDGSKDYSGKICDIWKKKDNRIKVIHQKNNGLGNARNVGIENSSGEYLFFIDSDDYIEVDVIEDLYKNILESESQIAIEGIIYESFDKQKLRYAEKNYIANSSEMIERLYLKNDIFPSVCGKMFKTELFSNIRFPNLRTSEDIVPIYKLFDKAQRISHINKAGYHYVQRSGSLIHREFSKEDLIYLNCMEEVIELIGEKYLDKVKYAEAHYIDVLNNRVILCYKNHFKEEYKNLKSKLKKYLPKELKNSEINLKTKLKSISIAYLGFSRFFKK